MSKKDYKRAIFIDTEPYSYPVEQIEQKIRCNICGKLLGISIYEYEEMMTTASITCLDCVKTIPMTLTIDNHDKDIP